MAKVRLTAAAIERYRPQPGKVREIPDITESLSLCIHPTGTKTWSMRFRRPNGKSGQLILGRYDDSGHELQGDPVIGQPLSLSAARALAASIHRQRRLGIDVIAEHQSQKRRTKLQAQHDTDNSFSAAAREFIDEYARPKTRRWAETATVLGWNYSNPAEPVMTDGGLSQRWSSKPVREIDDSDIFEIVKESGRSGIPGTAARTKGKSPSRERSMYAALSVMFSWLKSERRIKVNPCIDAVKLDPAQKRDRVLTNQEIVWFLKCCTEADAPRIEGAPRYFNPVFRLLLLTGQRLGEVSGMRRSELEGAEWHMPGRRTKNKLHHIVPLSRQALDLIPGGETDLVFSTTGHSPISGWSTAKQRLDEKMAELAKREKGDAFVIPNWTLHDLRRSAATHMGNLGIAPHVIEAVLNHVSGVKASVAGTYNRSLLLPERREALQRWADHLDGLVHGTGNVVPLRKKSARS